MANPSGIPAAAGDFHTSNFSCGTANSFLQVLSSVILQNDNAAAQQVYVWASLDGVLCGSWPISAPPGRSNATLLNRIQNLGAGGHNYHLYFLTDAASGVYLYVSEIGEMVLKA